MCSTSKQKTLCGQQSQESFISFAASRYFALFLPARLQRGSGGSPKSARRNSSSKKMWQKIQLGILPSLLLYNAENRREESHLNEVFDKISKSIFGIRLKKILFQRQIFNAAITEWQYTRFYRCALRTAHVLTMQRKRQMFAPDKYTDSPRLL